MRHSRIMIATVIAALSASALVGCVGTTTKADVTKSPKPSVSASPTLTPGITKITDTPGSGTGLVGALADSTISQCVLKSGSWSVTGTVKNPTTTTVKYRIYVSLLAGSGSTRALQQVDVSAVKAGATSKWDATIATAEDGLNCVLRVERYPA